jgi:formate dehydrogenase major subunit
LAAALYNSIDDVSASACILAIGSNTSVAHPVIALEVNKAVAKGAKLIVANPRNIALCRFADIWLRLNPGTDVALLMAMMKVIVDEDLYDKDFIRDRCENFEAFKDSLKKFDLAFANPRVPKIRFSRCPSLPQPSLPHVPWESPRVRTVRTM